MIFRIECRHPLWWVEDQDHVVGGLFVDLTSAIRFIRQYQRSARIVVSGELTADVRPTLIKAA